MADGLDSNEPREIAKVLAQGALWPASVDTRFEIAVEAFSSEPEAAAYIDAGLRLHLLGLDVPGVNIGNVVTRPLAGHDDWDMTEALTASVTR